MNQQTPAAFQGMQPARRICCSSCSLSSPELNLPVDTQKNENIFIRRLDFFHFSLRVLCARGVSGLCHGRLQAECDLPAWRATVRRPPPTPLARRQPAQQCEVRSVQEDLLERGVPLGNAL